ncbi:MAG: hypothetical protein AAFY56_04805 [Pseudomonadota bacterium]
MRWIEKRPLPKYLLNDNPRLDVAFRYWSDKRRGGLLPARSDVDTPAFRVLIGSSDWIDGSASEPERWPLGLLQSYAGICGMRSDQTLGELLRSDLATVAFTGSMLFQAVSIGRCDSNELYHVLVLPHADDGRRARDLLLLANLVQPVTQPSAQQDVVMS